jgi:hypothetical protein
VYFKGNFNTKKFYVYGKYRHVFGDILKIKINRRHV